MRSAEGLACTGRCAARAAVATCLLIAICAWPLGARSESAAQQPQRQQPAAPAEIRPYREAVRRLLSEEFRRHGSSLEGREIAHVGLPLHFPDHGALHAVPSPSLVPVGVPETLLLVMVGSIDDLEGVYRVGVGADADGVNGVAWYLRGGRNEPRMRVEEWLRLTRELNPFYGDLFDVTRGPSRFEPYLSTEVQFYSGSPMRPSRSPLGAFRDEMSATEFRDFAALVLDATVHGAWLAFEELCPAPPCLSYWMSALQDLEPRQGRRAVEELQGVIAEAHSQLDEIGALEPSHMLRLAPFLRRFAGEGLVAREPNRGRLSWLASEAELYLIEALLYAQLVYGDDGPAIVAIYTGS